MQISTRHLIFLGSEGEAGLTRRSVNLAARQKILLQEESEKGLRDLQEARRRTRRSGGKGTSLDRRRMASRENPGVKEEGRGDSRRVYGERDWDLFQRWQQENRAAREKSRKADLGRGLRGGVIRRAVSLMVLTMLMD